MPLTVFLIAVAYLLYVISVLGIGVPSLTCLAVADGRWLCRMYQVFSWPVYGGCNPFGTKLGSLSDLGKQLDEMM